MAKRQEPCGRKSDGFEKTAAVFLDTLRSIPRDAAEIESSNGKGADSSKPCGESVAEIPKLLEGEAAVKGHFTGLPAGKTVALHIWNSGTELSFVSIRLEKIRYREMTMIVGTGVDIVEIRRLREVLQRQGERFIRRVFTPGEQEYCGRHRDPTPHFAVRFAAKEALFKALGTGWAKGVSWLDVDVRRADRGAPSLKLSGEAEKISRALGATRVHLSLSHSNDSAVAVVVLEAL